MHDTNTFDGEVLRAALRETVRDLGARRELLNQINVYPVPDGDTGNNMLATLESALAAVEQSPAPSLQEISLAAYYGARAGSTGNSGAIMAQYLKGWAVAFYSLGRADARQVAQAFVQGAKHAYQAVLKPVEGTILTVAREAADAAVQAAASRGELRHTLLAAYNQARESLLQTSKGLAQLQRQDLVDAGGWGLLIFFSGILKAMRVDIGRAEFEFQPTRNYLQNHDPHDFADPFDMECVAAAADGSEAALRERLESLGSAVITQTDGSDCLVHIHTCNPLAVVERIGEIAPLADVIIRDMRRQAVPYGEDDHGRRDYRIVACGSSPGFVSMYAMAGADLAMTERLTDKKRRLLQAVDSDSTLLLSARPLDLPSAQDALVVLGEEARILAALVALYGAEKPSREAVEAAAGYARMARLVPGGAGYEALLDGERLAAGTLADAVTLAVGALHPQSGEVLTLYYGQGLPRARVEELLPGLRAAFPSLEGLDLYYGGQSEPLILNLE